MMGMEAACYPSILVQTMIALGSAGHGGIRSIMDDMTLLSTEAEGVNDTIPEDFKPSHVNAAGRVGALLGLTDDGSPSGESHHNTAAT